jgi:tyrosine-protein kinase Etk/Wzc
MNAGARERESEQIFSALGWVLRRRKALLLTCFLGVVLPAIYYNETTRPLYETSVSVIFEEIGQLVPGAIANPPDHNLFDRLEEINSRAFADDIARALSTELKAKIVTPEMESREADPVQLISDMIHANLSAYPLRNSNIVRIRVRMTDAYVCMAVADLALKVLQERTNRIRHEGVTDLRDFIEVQVARVDSQLQVSESNLRRFKEQNAIASLDSESREMLRKMTDAEALYNATRANRGAAEVKLTAIEQTLADQRRGLVPAVTNIASPSAQKLKEKLVSLQGQYAQLVVQDYREDHPQLVILKQEIEQTKKALAEEAKKLSQGSSVGDPIAQIERYADESLALQLEIASLKARESSLRQPIEQYRQSLRSLPAKEYELAQLVRERDVNQKLYTTLLERREEVRISEARQVPNARVIDRPRLPKNPIKPNKKLNLAAATVIGMLLGLGVGLVRERGASRLSSTAEVEQETGWPVLALIPEVKRGLMWRTFFTGNKRGRGGSHGDRRRSLVAHFDPESAAHESYLMLRTRLELLGVGSGHRTLLVTSTGPGDGKSTTLSNLAATFGAAGRSALVVDAEFRRPVVHAIFGVDRVPGLSDMLHARKGDETIQGADGESASSGLAGEEANLDPRANAKFRETEVEGVTVLPSGKRVWWELSRREMRALLEKFKKSYDVVLVDSAAPTSVHDTLMLCGIVDAVLVVVNARAYDAERLLETKNLLERAGANVVGAVVNKVDPGGRFGYYYSHH